MAIFSKSIKLFANSIFSLLFVSILSSCDKNSYERTNADESVNKNKTETALQLKSSHESVRINPVSWTNFNDGMKKAREEKKYAIVSFYTEWCMYCKKMESETYTDESIYNLINNKMVAIKVNAESDNKIIFEGKEITEQELAQKFGVYSYPTLFFMSNEKDAVGQIPGFVDADQLYTIASYVVSEAYKDKSLEEYSESIGKTIKI